MGEDNAKWGVWGCGEDNFGNHWEGWVMFSQPLRSRKDAEMRASLQGDYFPKIRYTAKTIPGDSFGGVPTVSRKADAEPTASAVSTAVLRITLPDLARHLFFADPRVEAICGRNDDAGAVQRVGAYAVNVRERAWERETALRAEAEKMARKVWDGR